MTLDLAVLAVLAIAALAGAASGALRQVISLAAAAAGVVAARAFADPVGDGLARTLARPARALAPILLFVGAFALASLAGALILRATRISRVVRGPADRAAGALLGGVKGALAAWAVLSALALAGEALPARVAAHARASDFAALAREHNLIARVDASAARTLERALAVARRARAEGKLSRDPESARLLERTRALGASGDAPLDPASAARAMDDPEVRALADRLAGRAPAPAAEVTPSGAADRAAPAVGGRKRRR